PLLHLGAGDHPGLHGARLAVPVAQGSAHDHVLGAHGPDRRLLALFLTDTTLSTTSFMGIIMMVGIVVSNGVLLVEYINELRRQGLPLLEAVPRGGRVRLRPILMTVLATVVGLLPMALALGVGTEANQPLAIAVIGGLLVSTFFTLVLIPTLYVIFEERWPRRLQSES